MEKKDTSNEAIFVLCPICSCKTKTKIRKDTVLENFPLFCPKCKNETLVSIHDLRIKVINEPDA